MSFNIFMRQSQDKTRSDSTFVSPAFNFDLKGEQKMILFYIFLFSFKVIFIAFVLLTVDQFVLKALGLTLCAYNVAGFFFIFYALLVKNLFQMKFFMYILILELALYVITAIGAEKGRYLLIILIGVETATIINNYFSIKRAKVEFAYHYFKKVLIKPDEICKSNFLIYNIAVLIYDITIMRKLCE